MDRRADTATELPTLVQKSDIYATRTNRAMMKSFLFGAAIFLLAAGVQTSAFVSPSCAISATTISSSRLLATELKPEPEGGEELTAAKTLDGSRMKNMGEVADVSSDEGKVFRFWLTANVEGALVKEIHTEVLKESAKKANFPGFRKGQVVRRRVLIFTISLNKRFAMR
jgi:hypothetical protein